MLDEIIRGGTVIDGTGAPGVRADVGIRDGRVVAVGDITEDAAVVTDATGCMVIPGIIDPHTHYDAQLLWDPSASPSTLHGVTSVVNGNCGFTLAPLRDGDADYLRRMMAQVEGMPLPALEEGVDWNWETFAEYLARLEGNLGVNAGFMVGHCAIRRYVMGPEATEREATPEELTAIRAELATALEAGGLGFSFTWSTSHSDGDGKPVASRWASADELEALCAETGAHPGTTLEGIVPGCLDQFADEEIELLARLSAAADRPMNWNVLTVDSKVPERIPRQLAASDRATELGGRVVALTMPVQVPMNMSLLNFCGLWLLPAGGRSSTCRWRSAWSDSPIPPCAGVWPTAPRRPTPACCCASPTGPPTASGTRSATPTTASRGASWATSPPSGGPLPSTRSSTSSSPTTCAPSCGRTRPMTMTRAGGCVPSCGMTPGR